MHNAPINSFCLFRGWLEETDILDPDVEKGKKRVKHKNLFLAILFCVLVLVALGKDSFVEERTRD